MHAKTLGIGSKALIEPEIGPPRWSDQVPEPLMSQLVTHDCSYLLLVLACRDRLIIQHRCLSEKHPTYEMLAFNLLVLYIKEIFHFNLNNAFVQLTVGFLLKRTS